MNKNRPYSPMSRRSFLKGMGSLSAVAGLSGAMPALARSAKAYQSSLEMSMWWWADEPAFGAWVDDTVQAYAAAKAGQINLTRQLCHELGEFGITVNNIAPGFVRSNPTTEKQWASYGEAGQKALVERIAMKRLGAPEDIAHGVLFFASDYAGWISGQVLAVDGGK